MITKREKLQYVYVFLTDLAALAASVILAWLIVGDIMGQLLPYSVLDWVQALVLLGLAYTVTFFCFDQTENIVKRTRGQEAKLSIKSNLLMMVIYSAFLTLSKAVLQDSRYFLVGVVSFNLFLLPAAHGLLKKLLVKAPDNLQNETLVGIVTTGDRAGKMIREISNDWSRRVCGVALLEATGDAIGTKVENIEVKANYDTFMNWLRRAALDEVYIDVPMDSGEYLYPVPGRDGKHGPDRAFPHAAAGPHRGKLLQRNQLRPPVPRIWAAALAATWLPWPPLNPSCGTRS